MCSVVVKAVRIALMMSSVLTLYGFEMKMNYKNPGIGLVSWCIVKTCWMV